MAAIIHELTLLQEREGWLSEDSLRALAERLGVPLHRVESVSTFYTHFRRTPPPKTEIAVCRDLSCMMGGGESKLAALRERFKGQEDVEITEVSCLGRCDGAPAACVGHEVVNLNDDSAVDRAIESGGHAAGPAAPEKWAADIYESPAERYGALRAALERDRADIVQTLKDSGLRGMGGAGFPTGLKWDLVAREEATPKYVICNADESEPGTFKDRQILSDLPHLVIEGLALAAYVIDGGRGACRQGWVFIRHEYEPERQALEAAIEEARKVGALGENIFGSNFSFDIEIFVSPGGYILGEETALIECMEDKRGEPRNKPPFPGQQGLWNQPTLMNNVETFAHTVGIVHKGLEWWNGLGEEGHAGHKFISVSGDVEKPGVYLVPMGIPIRGLLERAGGMKDGRPLVAVAPGGASSNFLPPDQLDVPMDFQTLADAGSMLGSGAAVFVAEGHDLLEVGVNVARFFRNESCGKCVPCRVGSEKAVALLEEKKKVDGDTAALLEELNETLYQTSICGLGQVALGPLLSIVRNFGDQIPRE